MKITAEELEVGMFFKQNRQRKWRFAYKIMELPEHQEYDILICKPCCGQVLLKKDDEIIIDAERINHSENKIENPKELPF